MILFLFIVLRYAHLDTHPKTWDEMTVKLIRVDGPPDSDSKCASANDGPIYLSLEEGALSAESPEKFCLEAGKRYQVELFFGQYDNAQPSQANIYIDSV